MRGRGGGWKRQRDQSVTLRSRWLRAFIGGEGRGECSWQLDGYQYGWWWWCWLEGRDLLKEGEGEGEGGEGAEGRAALRLRARLLSFHR